MNMRTSKFLVYLHASVELDVINQLSSKYEEAA